MIANKNLVESFQFQYGAIRRTVEDKYNKEIALVSIPVWCDQEFNYKNQYICTEKKFQFQYGAIRRKIELQ